MEEINNILVPTDFSDQSFKAIEFATDLAKRTGAKVTILHIYNLGVVPGRTPYVNPDKIKVQIENAELQFSSLRETIPGLSEINFEAKTVPMNWSREFPSIIHSQQFDLVIMGTKGSGGIREVMIGSNTASVIQGITKPLLAVPDECYMRPVKNIAFGYDHLGIENISKLDPLNMISRIFKASVHVFHIKTDAGLNESAGHIAEILEYLPAGTTFTEIEDEEVGVGIESFIESHHIDLLALMPRNKNLFERLFHKSITRIMAFHTRIPLLAIPE